MKCTVNQSNAIWDKPSNARLIVFSVLSNSMGQQYHHMNTITDEQRIENWKLRTDVYNKVTVGTPRSRDLYSSMQYIFGSQALIFQSSDYVCHICIFGTCVLYNRIFNSDNHKLLKYLVIYITKKYFTKL